MPQKERRSAEGKPPTAIQQAIKDMPLPQRLLVKTIGLGLMIGPAWVGMQIVPHLIHEGASWILALVILGFLSLTAFIGLLITVPKAAVYVGGLIPIPAKWRRLMERPDRRNS